MRIQQSLIYHQPKPLNYEARLPPYFQVTIRSQFHELHEIPDTHISLPVLVDPLHPAKWHTLQEILSNLKSFVAIVQKITVAMRKDNFDPQTCSMLMDHYYGTDWADWDVIPAQSDNYYYVLSTPELRSAEVALEILSNHENIDIAEARHEVDTLKRELWALLPDFYKGHSTPKVRPLSYQPHTPYPFAHISDNFIQQALFDTELSANKRGTEEESRPLRTDQAILAVTMDIEKVYMWATFKAGQQKCVIDLATYDSPYERILHLIQDIIVCKAGPSYFSYDAEGPQIEFYTTPSDQPQNIYFHVRTSFQGTWIVQGVFDRRQLAEELMKLCENPYPLDTNVGRVKIQLQKLRALL